MPESTWADWGRHIEDELVGVAPVLVYAATHAPIETAFGDIHHRDTDWTFLVAEEDVAEYADEHWTPNHVVHVRELPGLRFDRVCCTGR